MITFFSIVVIYNLKHRKTKILIKKVTVYVYKINTRFTKYTYTINTERRLEETRNFILFTIWWLIVIMVVY